MSTVESSAVATGAPLPSAQPVTVVLLRHGPVDDGGCCYGARVSPPLSSEAPARIAELGSRLPATFSRVISSPATRCRETARLLGLVPDLVDEAWLERDFGVWEGRPWTDVWSEVGEVTSADDFAALTPEAGEPWEAVRTRAGEALDALAGAGPSPDGAPIAVVTHGGIIRTVLSHILEIPIGTSLLFDPAPASATWLTSWGSGWTVARMGA